MLKFVTVVMFKVMGWKLEGHMPKDLDKCVLVAAPHTTNFDFFFAMASFYLEGLPVRYLIKREWADFFLFRSILRNSGALGVNRKKSVTMVDTMAEIIRDSKGKMALMIAPEGTRKLTRIWKTGFYYTALKAGVPLVLTYLDYSKKIAFIGPSFMPSGCYKKDMLILKEFYKDVIPKYPKNFSLDIYMTDEKAICAG